MDEDEERGRAGPDAPTPLNGQNQRGSSVPSILFITFMLFMLANHNGDEFLARTQYQNAMTALNYQLSNYTAWLNGNSSNFTMPDIDVAVNSLVSAANIFTGEWDEDDSRSYYSNVTGFIHGDAVYHNITNAYTQEHPLNVTWAKSATSLMRDVNLTELATTMGTWNWSATDKVALSVVEKTTVVKQKSSSTVSKDIAMVHGRIELTDANTAEDLRLEFEGVHFILNGSIYGVALPSGSHIDIRTLPSLVPPDWSDTTARVVEPELSARIEKFRFLIDTGAADQESPDKEDAPKSNCSFTLYAQITPAQIPRGEMRELESELEKPTGIWTIVQPKLELSGLLISKQCGIVFEVEHTEGLRSKTFFRKVTTYAGTAASAYLTLLVLFLRQMASSVGAASRGVASLSRWSFLSQAIIDSVSFAGHVTFAMLADGRPSLALVVPSFLACVLFIYETQFALLIHQVQIPEDVVAVQPTTPSELEPTTAEAVSPTPNALPSPAVQPSSQSSPSVLTLFIQYVRSDPQARLWIALFTTLTVVIRVILSPSLSLAFVSVMHSSIWMPQIVRSVRRGRASSFTGEYLIGTSICRMYIVMYFLACPKNVLDVEPRGWVYWLSGFVLAQALVVALQQRLGTAFFLPASFSVDNAYNYHPPLPPPATGSETYGDCAICMDSIHVDNEFSEKGEWDKRSLLHVGSRRHYSLAPCQHLFHTECLESWLAIKNICPQCRRPLPPI